MKRLLLIVLPLLLIVGCSKPISEETLIDKDGLKYHPDTKELYSGEVFQNWIGGEKKFEGSYKDGKEVGIRSYWDKNDGKVYKGQFYNVDNLTKSDESLFDNGSFSLLLESKKRGELYYLTLKDGKNDGLSIEWRNGQKILERSYKDDVVVKVIGRWNEDGSVRTEPFDWE